MSKFIKTVTTNIIVDTTDATGADGILMSVKNTSYGIDLVIGAMQKDSGACALSKEGLKRLINDLMDIHAAMEC